MKKAFALLLALCLCLGLCACGSAEPEQSSKPNQSFLPEQTTDPGLDSISGYWRYDNYDSYFLIEGNGTWKCYDMYDDAVLSAGDVTLKDDVMTLNDQYGGDPIAVLTVVSAKQLRDADGDTLSRYNPSDNASTVPIRDFWYYDDYDSYIYFYDDNTWEYCDNNEGSVLAYGSYEFDGQTVQLCTDSGDYFIDLMLLDEDSMRDSNGDMLSRRSLDYEPEIPYFESNGLSINLLPDSGLTLLENGARYYNDSGYYSRGDVYWTVSLTSAENTGDYRQVQFTATCYLLNKFEPNISASYNSGCRFELYDYYTGIPITTNDESLLGDTAMEDNVYYDSVEYGGVSYEISYSFSTEWSTDFANGYPHIVTLSYFVTMPLDYDGLVFAMLPSYATAADKVADEADDADYPLLEDPYMNNADSLFCSIN